MTATVLTDAFGLTGRRAIVTGASRGLGARAPRTLDTAGAQVALVARDQAQLCDVGATLAKDPLVVPADLSRNEGPAEIAAAVTDPRAGRYPRQQCQTLATRSLPPNFR